MEDGVAKSDADLGKDEKGLSCCGGGTAHTRRGNARRSVVHLYSRDNCDTELITNKGNGRQGNSRLKSTHVSRVQVASARESELAEMEKVTTE